MGKGHLSPVPILVTAIHLLRRSWTPKRPRKPTRLVLFEALAAYIKDYK